MINPIDTGIIHDPSSPFKSVEEEQAQRKYSQRYDGIAVALGAIALAAFTYSLEQFLTPFALIAALFLLLAPFREYRAAKVIMWTAGVLFFFWFFITLSGLLVPFILGLVIAYLFNPAVGYLEKKRHISRGWSAFVITLILVSILGIIGWLVIPSLIVQTSEFISRVAAFLKANSDALDEKHLRSLLHTLGLPPQLADQVLRTEVTPSIKRFFSTVPSMIFAFIKGIPVFVERMLNLIIVPIAAFYFMKDWPKMSAMFFILWPAKNRSRVREVFTNIDSVLYAYVRGQITVATIMGVLAAVAYYILGIPYAGLLGVILGIADLIPIAGMIFSAFIVELVIFLTMELNIGVIFSGVAVIAGLHLVEAYIIGPRIVGKGVGLPPVIMILALLIFGYFMGFVGLLIAVPAAAVIFMFIEEYRRLQLSAEPTPPKSTIVS